MNMNAGTFQGWIATLSDGTTVLESAPIPGERTSWQKLIDHLHLNGLTITGFQLQKGGIIVHPLVPKTCSGYYQAYDAHRIVFRNQTKLFQGIGSVVGEQVFITWVDDLGNVTQDIRPLSSERPHTTLRE